MEDDKVTLSRNSSKIYFCVVKIGVKIETFEIKKIVLYLIPVQFFRRLHLRRSLGLEAETVHDFNFICMHYGRNMFELFVPKLFPN